MKIRIHFICTVLFLTLVSGNAPAQETLTFGVVPQQSAQKLAAGWGPVCTYLSEKTGLNIRFATAPDIPEFERRLLDGRYDIAYMNPYHYTVFSIKPGYIAVAREKDKRIQGIVVVRKDAPYKDLTDLANMAVAFPSPAAFAASILPRAHCNNIGLPITPKYVKSHDSVYRNVARGFYAAGGGVMRTLQNTNPEVRNSLRILWKTDLFTPHAIAVHPRLSPNDRKQIVSALLRMTDDEDAGPLLKTICIKGFTLAADGDWDDVRALKIDMLMPLVKP